MKINNTTELKGEDFEKEYQNLVSQIGNILNPFMQQVVELGDGRIDFENTVSNYKEVEFTVDVDGKPILNNKISTGKTSIRGFSIIAAFNLTNSGTVPTQHPFISYTPVSSGVVQIDKITGLQANNKYRLNLVIY